MSTIKRRVRRQVAKAVLSAADAIAVRIRSEAMRNDVNTAAGRLWHALLPKDGTAMYPQALRQPSDLRKLGIKATAKVGGGVLLLTPRRARRAVSDLVAQLECRIAGTWDCEHEQFAILRTPLGALFRGCPKRWEGFFNCRDGCPSYASKDCDCDLEALFDASRAINVLSCQHANTRVCKILPKTPLLNTHYEKRCTRCNAYAYHRSHCAFETRGEECDCNQTRWVASP